MVTLQRYHTHSPRKQFLVCALDQLRFYIDVSHQVLVLSDEKLAVDATDMLCWHWNATGMLLCTRSDVALRIRKAKPLQVLASALAQWPRSSPSSSDPSAAENVELLAARLRRLCVLMSLTAGVKEMLQEVLLELEARGKFLLNLLHGLDTSIRRGSVSLVRLIIEILRVFLLNGDEQHDKNELRLVHNEEERRALLSWSLRCFKTVADLGAHTTARDPAVLLLQRFVVDLMVLSNACVAELQAHLRSSDKSAVMVRLMERVEFACERDCRFLIFVHICIA